MTRERAQELDAADPLGEFRDRFVIDDELVYLDGNSLGRLPRATVERLARTVSQEWGGRLIRGWDEGWMQLPLAIGDRLGEAALGAAPGQVAIGDSTTVCFYKLASAALDLRPERDQIVTDYDNFPTDRYALEGLARARGLELVFLRGDPAGGPEPDAVAAAVDERTALVTFSHVSYRSAHIADMEAITAIAHDAGALVLWDLSHPRGRSRLRSTRTGRIWPSAVPTSTSTAARARPRSCTSRASLQPSCASRSGDGWVAATRSRWRTATSPRPASERCCRERPRCWR